MQEGHGPHGRPEPEDDGGPPGASCSSGWPGWSEDAGAGPAQGTQESPGGVPPSSPGSGLSVGP